MYLSAVGRERNGPILREEIDACGILKGAKTARGDEVFILCAQTS